ncbi:MAG: T9SS type A sorting domain-containing protein [Bacteroidetes bacterium]|nr:MAG: T9SS type A sorting domain-containing protein [Bacteroidota bacterium]
MKKALLMLLLPLSAMSQENKKPAHSFAQSVKVESSSKAFLYVFQQTTGPYSDIVNPDYVYPGGVWDDPDIQITCPFPNTNFAGATYDSLYMDWGANLIGFNFTTGHELYLAATSADLLDRGYPTTTSQSTISYVIEGASPNRVFKMEWKNAGFFDGIIGGSSTDFTNTQIWMRENGAIEMHFGLVNVSSTLNDTLLFYGELLTGFGVEDMSGNLTGLHLLEGNPANPVLTDNIEYLDEYPASGTIYLFTYPISIDEENTIVLDVYPNPAVSELRINAEDGKRFSVRLMDVSGQLVKEVQMNNTNVLDISGLPRGVYIATLSDVDTDFMETIRLVLQ